MALSGTINEDDYVILQKGKNLQLVQVRKKRKINLERKFFDLDPAIGESYGTTWEITKRKITKVEATTVSTGAVNTTATAATVTTAVSKEDNTGSDAGGDNRNIVDDNTAQKLSQDEILALKKDGLKGEDLIGQIVENSATFKEKNIYSQAKYIKKKKDKHIPIFKILKPTTRLLCEMYYAKASPKVVFIRYDTMGQILTFGNIHANMKVMVVESTNGLLLGAVMDRMGGYGTVVQLYHGDSPSRIATDGYNFPKEHYKTLYGFPLSQANSLSLKTESELIKPCSDPPDCCCSDNEEGVVEKKQKIDSPSGDDNHCKDAVVLDEKNTIVIMDTDSPSEECEKTLTSENPGTSPEEKTFSDKNSVGDNLTPKDVDLVASTTMETDCLDDGMSSAEENSKDAKDDNDEEKGIESKNSNQGKRKRIPYPERVARKEKRKQDLEDAKYVMESGHFDALVIACKFDPAPILMKLLEFLSPSRPFIVFCQFIEPLYECFGKIRESKESVNVKITESWLREYQVLPMRTHPQMNMSGTGGYLLTGIKVNT